MKSKRNLTWRVSTYHAIISVANATAQILNTF
jgi:hypothetical protein